MKHPLRSYIRAGILAVAAFVFLFSSPTAWGADLKFGSSMAVSEEYTDNLFLDDIHKDEDYITRLTPSVTLQYETSLWLWDLGYTLDYVYYASGERDDEAINDGRVKGHVNVVKDFFFVDVSDRYSRVSLDATRDYTLESTFVNQSDRNEFSISPYIELRPGRAVVKTGYGYSNIWYKTDIAEDRESHAGYAEIAMELSPRVESSAGYRYTREHSDSGDFKKNDAHLGLSYEYLEESRLYFTVGNTWLDFDNGANVKQVFWKAGVNLRLETLEGSLETSRSYSEDPEGDVLKLDEYIGSLQKRMKRTSVGLSGWLREYSDGETNDLETVAFGARGSITRELMSKTTAILDITVEKLDRKLETPDLKRYLGGLRIDYLLMEDLVASLEYRYAESDTETSADSYRNNRVIFLLRKSFGHSSPPELSTA